MVQPLCRYFIFLEEFLYLPENLGEIMPLLMPGPREVHHEEALLAGVVPDLKLLHLFSEFIREKTHAALGFKEDFLEDEHFAQKGQLKEDLGLGAISLVFCQLSHHDGSPLEL